MHPTPAPPQLKPLGVTQSNRGSRRVCLFPLPVRSFAQNQSTDDKQPVERLNVPQTPERAQRELPKSMCMISTGIRWHEPTVAPVGAHLHLPKSMCRRTHYRRENVHNIILQCGQNSLCPSFLRTLLSSDHISVRAFPEDLCLVSKRTPDVRVKQ